MAQEQIININLGVDMNNTVSIPEYSSGKTFLFYIDNYTIPDDAEVKIFVKKPSGHEVLCTCAFEDNKITAPCLLQMVAEVGKANGQIQIYQGGSYVYSFVFTLDVVSNPYAAMKIESSDEYRTLEELIASASYIIEDVNKAEALRKEEETARQTAETERQTAEDTRIANENQRIANENERITNENQRKTNEETRTTNEETRKTQELERDSAESARISQENERVTEWATWQSAIAEVQTLESRIEGLENPAAKYVLLDDYSITRGKYDSDSGKYTSGCTMTYSPSEGGLVISFL
jgi:flagellar biosynthesis GTPase FlhF